MHTYHHQYILLYSAPILNPKQNNGAVRKKSVKSQKEGVEKTKS